MKINSNETTQNSFDFSHQRKLSVTDKDASLPYKRYEAPETDGHSSEKVDKEHIKILKKEAIDASTNSIARSIRASVETMYKASEALESMEQHLNGVVKYFPPYPPGNEDRINYLNKFNALKKQLDQLAIGANAHNGIASVELNLDLPEISTIATNDEINQYKARIDSAKKIINDKHESIVTDSKMIKDFLLG